jgi:uncharacterized protein (DUF2141 family)
MKTTSLIVFIIFLTFSYASDNKNYGRIEVFLQSFNSDNGNIRVYLYDIKTKKSFPTESSKSFKSKISKIRNNKSIVVFDSLPYGYYSIAVHHDENLNEKMDLNILGLPAEGWGLSKNVLPVFKLPDFEECQIDLEDTKKQIRIVIRY